MQIVQTTAPSALDLATAALSRGELVIYPTETCYGLAADASNQLAVERLFAYKGDRYRQVSVAVSSQAMAEKYVVLNDIAKNIYSHLLPGPITVISHSLHQLDQRLESAEGKLGIRIPLHDFALSLLKAFGKPITATSANTSGQKEPYSLSDWQKYTSQNKQAMVSLFLDAGKLAERPTSTVVDTTLNEPTILRQGELILPHSSPVFLSRSPAESQQFAADLLRKHLNLTRRFPLLIALQGDLGVGKTVASKGFAQALGVKTTVSSPTYTLMREYPYDTGKYTGTFYHLDTWRLSNMAELETTLHLSSLLKPGNLVVLEWAGKAKEFIERRKNDTAIILIDIKEIKESTRQITYSVSTPEWT